MSRILEGKVALVTGAGSPIGTGHAMAVALVRAGASPVETVFDLGTADRKTQFVAVAFGNALPLDRAAYERAFGAPIESDFGTQIARLVDAELLVDDDARIDLTETGKLVYDRVLLCFYPERARRWLKQRAGGARVSRA